MKYMIIIKKSDIGVLKNGYLKKKKKVCSYSKIGKIILSQFSYQQI